MHFYTHFKLQSLYTHSNFSTQTNAFRSIFFIDKDEEYEVNSLTLKCLKDVDVIIQASTSSILKIPQAPIDRDCFGTHDRLVVPYFGENPMYDARTIP